MKLNPDWFWIGTHSYTLTSFIKLKPLASLHCHCLRDIHQANTSPTYYIRYHEHDTVCDVIMVTASQLTGNGRSAQTSVSVSVSILFSLRQVGGRKPGSRQDVTLPLIPDEGREINQHLYPVWKDFVGSHSVISGVQSKSHKDTLRMTSSWWLRRMGDPACMCITQL